MTIGELTPPREELDPFVGLHRKKDFLTGDLGNGRVSCLAIGDGYMGMIRLCMVLTIDVLAY
jgi:hypothetical protein